MHPFQCDLQPQLQEAHRTTHRNNHCCKTHRRNQTTAAATAAQTRYLSSPALRGKTQGFVLRLPLQNKAHATYMQPFQCDLQPQLQETHRITHRNNHCCKTHRRNQTTAAATAAHTRYLSSPAAATLHGKTQGFVLRLPPQLTTCLRHRFPSSPLPFLTTPLHHHFPSSPLPFLTTSHRHRFPSSPLPFLTTPLHHHFPSSPLPFLTASHRHRFPSSPLPFLTTPLHHHFPSSPLPIVTTSHRHHVPSSPPRHCQHPSSRSIPPLLILLLCIDMLSFQISEFYLSVTRKCCFPTSFDNSLITV